MTYHGVLMMGATSGAGTGSPSGPFEYPLPDLGRWGRVVQFLVFSIVFCRLLFVHLSFFFDFRFSDYPVGIFLLTCWYFLINLLVFSYYPVGIFLLTCWYFLIILLVFSNFSYSDL